jgi:hypothetical protein
MVLTDFARFETHDSETVVAASFACPYCIRTASEISLDLDESDTTAEALCTCLHCHSAWLVQLNGGQALRVALGPPGELPLRVAG